MSLSFFISLFTISSLFFNGKLPVAVSNNAVYDYVVYYDYNAQVNKTDTTKVLNERMCLFVGDQGSLYLSYNKYLADSMLTEQVKNPKTINGVPSFSRQGAPRSQVNYRIEKALSDNSYSFYNMLGMQYFSYSDKLEQHNWQVVNEQKVILGYTCQKATTRFAGRDYIAWFTSAIPIPDGPYKFHGLPGLILEVADTKNQYSFKAVGLQKNKSNLESSTSSQRTYKSVGGANDYKKIRDKFKNDPAPFFETDKMKLPPELIEKAVKNATEMLKLQDNPLELDE